MSLPEMSLDAARWRPHCGCQSEGLTENESCLVL